MRSKKVGMGAALVVGLGVGVAFVARADGPPAPPPEAYSACDGKAGGDPCTVTFGDRSITGTCTEDNAQKLFCRPEHMPPPPRGE